MPTCLCLPCLLSPMSNFTRQVSTHLWTGCDDCLETRPANFGGVPVYFPGMLFFLEHIRVLFLAFLEVFFVCVSTLRYTFFLSHTAAVTVTFYCWEKDFLFCFFVREYTSSFGAFYFVGRALTFWCMLQHLCQFIFSLRFLPSSGFLFCFLAHPSPSITEYCVNFPNSFLLVYLLV